MCLMFPGGFGSDFCSGNFEESWKDRGRFVEIAAEKFAASAESTSRLACLGESMPILRGSMTHLQPLPYAAWPDNFM